MEMLKLNNGIDIPSIGLGTFLISPSDAENTVREALKIGYSLIDTANMYINEKAVGRGIKSSGVDRKEIFLSTKIWSSEYKNENAINETLERLNVDYIDLLFLHQPTSYYLDAYKMIEKAYKKGIVRSIGVSNFEGKYIDDILSNCEIKPQVIQVEAHPYWTQQNLREILTKENIKLMSWYPLGHGDKGLFEEKILLEIAKKYKKTVSQIILRWHIDMGFIPIPGTKNLEHVKQNFDIFDFKLDTDDMKNIQSINKNQRYYTRTDEKLKKYEKLKPEYEKA